MNANEWMGLTVKQVRAEMPEAEKFVGRVSTVEETVVDENGVIHLRTADGIWCPSRLVETVK